MKYVSLLKFFTLSVLVLAGLLESLEANKYSKNSDVILT